MRKILLLLVVLGMGAASKSARAEDSCGPKSGLCWPEVKRGASGPRVVALQYLLLARGYKIAPDGKFAYVTESAVRKFQAKNRLKVDGKVGWQSWEAITPSLKSGDKGNAVRALQSLLSQSGYKVARDGVFGVATQKALMGFEKSVVLLKPDNRVNDGVWCYLSGGRLDGE